MPVGGCEELEDQRVAEPVAEPLEGRADEGGGVLGEAGGQGFGEHRRVVGIAGAMAPVEREEGVEEENIEDGSDSERCDGRLEKAGCAFCHVGLEGRVM